MASGLTDKMENFLIDFLFRGVALTGIATATAAAGTGPATWYVALYTSTPTDSAAGTEVTTTTSGYARVAVSSNSTNWANTQNSGTGVSSGTGGLTQNLTSITFGTPGPSNWGTVTGFALCDTASGATNICIYGDLTASKTVNNGDPAPLFAAGALTFTIG